MILYHGTDLFSGLSIMRYGIELSYGQKFADFGQGFYTTTDFDQAFDWAQNTNAPCVLSMTFHEEGLAGKTFDTPNMEWAKFVVENRLGIYNGKKYDYIVGPMADTGISRIRIRYRDGKISFDDAVDSIVGKTNGNQLVMLTKDALKKTRDIRKLVP